MFWNKKEDMSTYINVVERTQKRMARAFTQVVVVDHFVFMICTHHQEDQPWARDEIAAALIFVPTRVP